MLVKTKSMPRQWWGKGDLKRKLSIIEDKVVGRFVLLTRSIATNWDLLRHWGWTTGHVTHTASPSLRSLPYSTHPPPLPLSPSFFFVWFIRSFPHCYVMSYTVVSPASWGEKKNNKIRMQQQLVLLYKGADRSSDEKTCCPLSVPKTPDDHGSQFDASRS